MRIYTTNITLSFFMGCFAGLGTIAPSWNLYEAQEEFRTWLEDQRLTLQPMLGKSESELVEA
jgi:hypothetical protein